MWPRYSHGVIHSLTNEKTAGIRVPACIPVPAGGQDENFKIS
jgi:hypothetical protein